MTYRKIGVFLFLFISQAAFLTSNLYAQEIKIPQAECVRDVLTISQLPDNGRKVAVRIDNTKNGWDLTSPLNGDFAVTIKPQNGKYSVSAISENTYNWWVHLENSDGSFSKAYGGRVYCGYGAPSDFSYVCQNNKVIFSWKPVEKAESYAIRIDDKENGWKEKKPLSGDVIENNLRRTTYEMKYLKAHKYDAWVHAVDKKQNFSRANKITVDCQDKNIKEISFMEQLKAFFSSLFK